MVRRFLLPMVGIVSVVLLVGAVFPTRTYLNQRDAIAAEEAKVRVLSTENQKLAARVTELDTDAEIERLAREQYNLVRPGEEAYAILPAPTDNDAGSGATTDTPPAPPPVGLDTSGEESWWDDAVDALTFWD